MRSSGSRATSAGGTSLAPAGGRDRFARRRALLVALGGRTRPLRWRLGWGLGLFLAGFAVRSLHAVDLAPVLHTPKMPGVRMTHHYDEAAVSILQGEGILFPVFRDPSDTGPLARPPGYSIFLSLVYATAGRSFFAVQLVQNLVDSAGAVLIFLIAGRTVGWRVGVVAGLLAAVDHTLAYYSNLVLPDALCVIPILAAFVVLLRARRTPLRATLLYALAGAIFGLSAWLRPNALSLAPFLAATLVLAAPRRAREVRRSAALLVGAALAILPITARNYALYGRFVPVSINMGIVLWEGIADAGGDRFGAKRTDVEVAQQEGIEYRDPRYARWWASPDGITRDRDRTRKSLEVIRSHPVWFMGTMLGRMGRMLDYLAPAPPLLQRRAEAGGAAEAGDPSGRLSPDALGAKAWAGLESRVSPGDWLAPGRSAEWLRPLARGLQAVAQWTMLPFLAVGAGVVWRLSRRRALLLSSVPLCYLTLQSTMHLEFRVTLPMDAFLFVFAATTWVLIGAAVRASLARLPGVAGVWPMADRSRPQA